MQRPSLQSVLQCVAVDCRVAVLQGVVVLKELLPLQAAALLAEHVAVCYSVHFLTYFVRTPCLLTVVSVSI